MMQSETDYRADGSNQWGTVSTERQSRNNVNIVASGGWSTSIDSTTYFVCKTSETLEGLNIEVDAISSTLVGK